MSAKKTLLADDRYEIRAVAQKPAPKTATLPTVTRELIAIWESELDQFVADIQTRLLNIATSYSELPEPPFPSMEPPALPAADARIELDVSQPAMACDSLTPIDQDTSSDRLLAVKQKIAARLLGKTS